MNIAQIEQNIDKLISDFTSGNVKRTDFIYELLLSYGHRKQSVTRLRSGERNLSEKDNEVIWRRHLYFRTVDSNVLHAEIDQIRSEKVIERYKLRFIIVTNFNQLLAIDTKTTDSLDIELSELPKHFDFFLPWAGMEKAVYQGENPADVKAAEKMAKLFDLIKDDNFNESNNDDKEELHNLNVFLTRILFCFFAEDTEIFTTNQFSNVIKSHTNEDGSDLSDYLNRLFNVLNTDEENRKDLPDYIASFPYVNGGLFSDDIQSPTFSAKSRRMLIECGSELDWSDINPDIFGSMIQAVVHPDQRGGMGMHYTSVTNIMKVIEPLFLNDLYEQFDKYEDKPKKLQELLQRLGSIKIFDPACGSGNFLIIAYKELRNLEMDVLKQLQEIEFNRTGQKLQPFSEIKLSQFYGIELDDFAHEVAILSLWLAEHQMNVEFKAEFGEALPTLPLKHGGHIIAANATRCNWENVCPNHESEVYVCGNPPYLGQRNHNQNQIDDMAIVFDGVNNFKNLDYISCWFIKAARYIKNKNRFAFVTTNSLCQGSQVAMLWPHIFNYGLDIKFAYTPFKWKNNARDNAGVMCTIIGVEYSNDSDKYLYSELLRIKVKHINAYLVDGGDTIISSHNRPISDLPLMMGGNQPREGGFLCLRDDEKNNLLREEPDAERFIKKLAGTNEFLKNIPRWCIWIEDDEVVEAQKLPLIKERIDAVRAKRASGNTVEINFVNMPHRFVQVNRAKNTQIVIPNVSTVRRKYVPVGFVNTDTIITNLAMIIFDADSYTLGLVTSHMHMLWVRAVAGRLGDALRYTVGLCYNSFPVPDVGEAERENIAIKAMGVVSARENHPDKSLEYLYDPDKMPDDLLKAHQELDLAVDSIYSKSPFLTDDERLVVLFNMYEKMTGVDNA